MKIAILHDDFSILGGGEKLVSILAENLRKRGLKTDIYTFDISEKTKKIIPKVPIKTISSKKFSFKDYAVQRYLFSHLKLQGYDLFIFSGHSSLYAAKNNRPGIFYCHNIIKPEWLLKKERLKEKKQGIRLGLELMDDSFREKIWGGIYNLKNEFIKTEIPKVISRKIDAVRFLFANSFNLELLKYRFIFREIENVKHIQKIIVNSNNIQNKVKKYYKRDSIVINPPIETKKYKNKTSKNFWLSVNRIAPLKRIELQLKAFTKLPDEKLCIIGDIENPRYYEVLEKIKPKNVEFLGVLKEKELIKKLSECKGLIFTAKDEDFGMAPVEAMASGKPVIAPNEGGCKETIINKKTGILINSISENKIVEAVKKINKELKKNPKKYKNSCIKQAKKFDVKIFIRKIKEEIER